MVSSSNGAFSLYPERSARRSSHIEMIGHFADKVGNFPLIRRDFRLFAAQA